MPTDERNSLAYWYPKIRDLNIIPQPKTLITAIDPTRGHHWELLTEALDGNPLAAQAVKELAVVLNGWAKTVGYPCFVRTGHTSAKHGWEDACFVGRPEDMESHILEIITYSVMADLFGLPLDSWVVREMIPTEPITRCVSYGNFPVVREFRFFSTADTVLHVQPYWPPDAVAQGEPDTQDWEAKLEVASRIDRSTYAYLANTAALAVRAIGHDAWSVDFLQSSDGSWWLTDMALADNSYKWGESL